MKTNVVLECVFPPHFLNKNWKNSLLDILRERYENTSHTLGYIKTVNKMKDVIHNWIDSNHCINIKVFCDCDVIILKVGNVLKCQIQMIHNSGVFVNLSHIKILVPNKNNFTCEDNKLTIGDKLFVKDDWIDVQITNIRYEKNKYSCLGIFI
jgi:DNA-directed RNA polymerase subunit E'/Rpb7